MHRIKNIIFVRLCFSPVLSGTWKILWMTYMSNSYHEKFHIEKHVRQNYDMVTNDMLVLSLFSSCKCNITGWFVWYRGQVLIPLHLSSSEWPSFGWDLCSLGRDCFPVPWSFFYNQCICLLYGGQWDAASFSCCISCPFPCGAYLLTARKLPYFQLTRCT